jgi:cvfA/B/C family virulence factor
MGVLTVIWWRDIPAQVVAKDGRRASKIVLHPRFQTAIDRAAVKAGRRSMDEYIAEWHKVQRPCGDDLEAEATAEVARLEATYTRRVLDHLVTTGGAEDPDAPSTGKPTAPAATTSAAKPAAKEPG